MVLDYLDEYESCLNLLMSEAGVSYFDRALLKGPKDELLLQLRSSWKEHVAPQVGQIKDDIVARFRDRDEDVYQQLTTVGLVGTVGEAKHGVLKRISNLFKVRGKPRNLLKKLLDAVNNALGSLGMAVPAVAPLTGALEEFKKSVEILLKLD